MAITFQKQPLNFFNVNEPAIFEFTSDEDLGVNPNDLVADLELKSLWTDRRYVIKNILPKYGTGVFRVDVQGYLKSLMLDNFEYRFDSGNRQYTIERFSIGVSIHAENTQDVFGDAFVFDSGYIFDETFIFADETPNDTETNQGFYPTIGLNYRSRPAKPVKDPEKYNILAPKYIEFASGFTNRLSVFKGEILTVAQLSVGGATSPIPMVTGVSTPAINETQITNMYLPTRIIPTLLNNEAIEVYGISYKPSDCEETLQFRFFTSYGGYCYFYTAKEAGKGDRSKSEFINNDFYNQQDSRSSQVQRDVDYNETLTLSGIKQLELLELFQELLTSPKIEVLLPQGFYECEVKGGYNTRPLDFEYNLTVTVSNSSQMTL